MLSGIKGRKMNKDTKIVWLAVDTLIPYEHNAKEHTPTQINNISIAMLSFSDGKT